ncbi:MAG: efflux RND transporter periplasmic adaptor subunit [Gammaproteobacteria bacterium]
MIRKHGQALAVAFTLLLAGCDRPNGDDHTGAHVHNETNPKTHAGAIQEQGAAHDHGSLVEHGHGPEAVAVTHFTDGTELFLEYPPLVVGEESAFAAHLTRLDDFLPVAVGRLTARLSGGGLPEETFSVDAPSIPGIFRPVARPAQAGERTLELILESPDLSTTHHLGTVTVYPDRRSAAAAVPHEAEPGDDITFLKEQQWKVDFATAEVQRRRLRASITATGTIKARSNGEALVSAATAGHLLAGETFPRIGGRLSRGDALATIVPRVAGEVDVASLELEVQRARSELQLAVRERKRLTGLVAQQAAPKKRLNEAESVERIARAELAAATQRLDQYQRTLGSEDPIKTTGVIVRAPIEGMLAEIRVAPGSYVEEGQPMFHIVKTDRLWLEASVAEADLGRIKDPTGAWFSVEGFDRTFEIDAQSGDQLVAFGNVVDSVRRTVPLVFEFANPDGRLRVGMFAQVHIWTGETVEDAAVPVEALTDEAGQPVVYVMRGGESFERRVLRLGIREGGYVQVRSGLEPGERIVTRGAYLVRLAAASPAAAGHGHAH